MKKAKPKTKPARVEDRTEALQKAQIAALRRVKKQQQEISRLLRQVDRLKGASETDLFEFARRVVERGGVLRVVGADTVARMENELATVKEQLAALLERADAERLVP